MNDYENRDIGWKDCVLTFMLPCCCMLSWLLSLVVLILVVGFPLFVIEIDTLNGEKIDLNDFASAEDDYQHLLEIRCFSDHLLFTGFAAEEGEGEINGITWKSGRTRNYAHDVCIPHGLQGILKAQTWYGYEDMEETCNSTHMYQIGEAMLTLSIIGLCFLPFCFYSMAKMKEFSEDPQCCCRTCGTGGDCEDVLFRSTPLLFLFQGLIMIGLLVCTALHGHGNLCGEQGDNTMYIVLIIIIVCGATSSFIMALLSRRMLKMDLP